MMTSEPSSCHDKFRLVSAQVVSNRLLPGGHGLLRLAIGELAGQVQPGQFLQLTCDASLTLPRPFSLMDADPEQGTVDLFYRIVGRGTGIMAGWRGGESVFVLAPLGRGFTLPKDQAKVLLLAGGAGLAPVSFLASRLTKPGTLLWGIETESPLELGVVTRMASMGDWPGRFQGYVTDLALEWLLDLDEATRMQTVIYACGPLAMLQAVYRLAKRFGLRGQVSLEERMACGFGGCAACVAPIRTLEGGWSYRKICTEGPVFSLMDVAWERYTG